MGYKMRSTAPWFQFDNVGDEVLGVVDREVTEIQSTDQSGQPVFWDAAKTRPKMVPVMTLKTDNGQEFAIGLGGNKWTAMANALKEAGTDEIEEGAKVWIKFYAYSDQPPKVKGGSKAKLYRAKYQPPPKGYKMSQPDDTGSDDYADPWAGDEEPPF